LIDSAAELSHSLSRNLWELSTVPFVFVVGHQWRSAMTKSFVTFAAVAVMTLFAPALSMAQGVGVEVPGVGGVRIGEPDRPRYREDRDYDRPRYREGREYREREGSYGRGCKTITIQRDDGSVKRIRRCDGD
jgi:hypothetical protein